MIGLCDELMKDTIDPNTGESLGCWDTMNTDMRPEVDNSPRILYDLKVQGVNSETIVAFIDMVESGKLRILEKRAHTDYSLTDRDNFETNVAPFIQTDFLLEEVANLQLEHLASNKLSLKRVVKKYNKDRYSSLSYGLWYIKNFEDNQYGVIEDEFEYLKQFTFL